MIPGFPAGARNWEMGPKRKGKQEKEEFLEGKCNQVVGLVRKMGC